MHLFYLYQFLLKYLFYHILAYIFYINSHLNKFQDSIYHLFQKMIVSMRNFSISFKGKLSSELNLIFM